MNFSKRSVDEDQNVSLMMGGRAVDFNSVGIYLGIGIDKELSFAHHVGQVCDKMSKIVGIMYKISHIAPRDILLRIYYSMIYPYLTYCLVVWGGAATVHTNKILLLQKRVVRIITGSEYTEHSEPLFRLLG